MLASWHAYARQCTPTCTYIYACTHMYIHTMRTHAYIHVTYGHVHSDMYTRMHTCTHARAHTQSSLMHTYIRTRALKLFRIEWGLKKNLLLVKMKEKKLLKIQQLPKVLRVQAIRSKQKKAYILARIIVWLEFFSYIQKEKTLCLLCVTHSCMHACIHTCIQCKTGHTTIHACMRTNLRTYI